MLKESPIKVGKRLGEGLNANVYKAVSNSKEFGIKQTYALKVLKRKGDLKHFKKEFNTLLKTEGPHLVKLFGWKTYKGKPALLLEYIDGVSLEELLDSETLSDEESNWIYHETIAGLIELNSNNMFHGDLSPKNIMISNSGELKLIDFGLTKWRTKQIEVTPEFASPEILDGTLPTFKHDFYSLNKIFEQFKLTYFDNKPVEAPKSLSSKILDLQTPTFTTQTLEPSNKKSYKNNLKLAALLFSSFAFFKPISAQNKIPKLSSLSIRSKNWLSVRTTDQKKWCFTPCTLKVPNLGVHEVHWKSKSTSGTSKIFVENNGQTLFLDIE